MNILCIKVISAPYSGFFLISEEEWKSSESSINKSYIERIIPMSDDRTLDILRQLEDTTLFSKITNRGSKSRFDRDW